MVFRQTKKEELCGSSFCLFIVLNAPFVVPVQIGPVPLKTEGQPDVVRDGGVPLPVPGRALDAVPLRQGWPGRMELAGVFMRDSSCGGRLQGSRIFPFIMKRAALGQPLGLFLFPLVRGGDAHAPSVDLGEVGEVVVPQPGGDDADRQLGGGQQQPGGLHFPLEDVLL